MFNSTNCGLLKLLLKLGPKLGLLCLAFLSQSCQQAQNAAITTTGTPTQPTSTVQRTPVVTTAHGPVRGFVEDNVLVFKGIRYGADTATTRFAAPALPSPWTEPQDALLFGDSAPQRPRGNISLFKSWENPQPAVSEDCLFLNVWTPAVTDATKRPVMVWLHGGGFSTGSGSSNAYDGVRLANRGDVVVVTVNHRLNTFGYLYLAHKGAGFADSGSAGMLDLVAALSWVRDNISEFGGDPNNVMIFGESGGGFKVSTLMAMDSAQGLFHRAAIQSGPGLTLLDPAQAMESANALLAELGIDENNLADLQTIPSARIQAAADVVAEATGTALGGRPVVDGISIKRHPFTPDAPRQSNSVPLLIGSVRTEMSLLAGARRPDLFELTWETLPEALRVTFRDAISVERTITGYRALHPHLDPPNLYFEAVTDNSVFVRGSFDLADRKADQGGAPVYQYYLTWNTPVEGGKWGAPHALDIGFVFDNVAKSESMSGTGPEQQAIADMMSEAWLAFARAGDPNHSGLPQWHPYTSAERATMVFDTTPQLVNDPRRRELELLDTASQ